MIELSGVTKVFNENRPNRVVAVAGVDLAVAEGALTVLEGPSGSGKTTLLTLIGCLARPSTGRIRLDGEIVSGLPERFVTEIRRRTFGFVFQKFNLIRGLTALDNVMLPAFPLGIPHARLRDRALELLDHFGVGERADLAVENLSGGEAQRVAIARALVNDPKIVIADEPTANLDGARLEQFLAIAADLRAEGKTIIVTSHDPRITRASIVDRRVSMADGLVVEEAS